MPATNARQKLSTTVSPEAYAYLQFLVKSGRAHSLAEAVDITVLQIRQADNRLRLEHDTAAYFQSLSPKAAKEERRLEKALGSVVDEVNFDL